MCISGISRRYVTSARAPYPTASQPAASRCAQHQPAHAQARHPSIARPTDGPIPSFAPTPNHRSPTRPRTYPARGDPLVILQHTTKAGTRVRSRGRPSAFPSFGAALRDGLGGGTLRAIQFSSAAVSRCGFVRPTTAPSEPRHWFRAAEGSGRGTCHYREAARSSPRRMAASCEYGDPSFARSCSNTAVASAAFPASISCRACASVNASRSTSEPADLAAAA